jgi:predicted transcriptional regulator
VDFDKVKKVLKELRDTYPETESPESLQDSLNLEEDELKTIRSYLQEQDYIKYLSLGTSDFKITSEGIDFLEELNRKESREIRNKRYKQATYVIAIFTALTFFNGISTSSADIDYLAGENFECPNLNDNSLLSFTFSNNGGSNGIVWWELKSQNITIEPVKDYNTSEAIDISKGGELYPSYSVRAKEDAKTAKIDYFAEVQSKWSLGILNLRRDLDSKTCEYVKEDNEWKEI